jgi:Zn-dependent protease
VIFALAQPVSLAGLLLAFVCALALRSVVQRVLARRLVPGAVDRGPLFQLKRDADIFGFVGALFGGTGWGRPAPLPEFHGGSRRPHDAGRRAVVLLAPPVLLIVLSQLILAGYRTVASATLLPFATPANTLVGLPGPAVDQFVLSFAIGLMCWGILDLVPLPPLDGWGLLRLAVRHEGPGMQKARHWLVDQNIGTAILVFGMLPILGGVGLWVIVLDALATPLLVPWR